MEYAIVRPASFVIALTRDVIKKYAKGRAANLTVDLRGDVDDYQRYPFVSVQPIGAELVDGPTPAATRIRVRWVFEDIQADDCEDAAVEFMQGLLDFRRAGERTTEGGLAALDITQPPVLIYDAQTTADINEFNMIAEIIAVRRSTDG
jgi:hypothetical protein|nr:MAG TPA: hypothetical protein [Caudoviricetes sp.]